MGNDEREGIGAEKKTSGKRREERGKIFHPPLG